MNTEKAYNHCPACGRRIDTMRALFGNEKNAFRCRGCNTRLVKKTANILLAGSAFASWYAVKVRFGWAGWQTWASIAALLAIVMTITLTLTRVRLATEQDPDGESDSESTAVVSDDPPPLNPSFRGMSGPPPDTAPARNSSAD